MPPRPTPLPIPTTTPTPRTEALRANTRAEARAAVDAVARGGARVVQLSRLDGYALVYAPTSKPRALVVTCHGHHEPGQGWPDNAISRWLPHARRLGLVVAALDWHDGEEHYRMPDEIDAMGAELRTLLGLQSVPAVFHGFSRGGSQAFALASMGWDVIVDSAGFEPGYPPHEDLVRALDEGVRVLDGCRAVTFAGIGDVTVNRRSITTIPAADALIALGAGVVAQTGGTGVPEDHGAWLSTPALVDAAFTFLLA